MVIACPDQGEGMDQETFELASHHQGPTFINAYCHAVANLVDRDRGGGNDLPWPSRSALSECFV